MLIHLASTSRFPSRKPLLTPTSLERELKRAVEIEHPDSHLRLRVSLVARYSMLGQVGNFKRLPVKSAPPMGSMSDGIFGWSGNEVRMIRDLCISS